MEEPVCTCGGHINIQLGPVCTPYVPYAGWPHIPYLHPQNSRRLGHEGLSAMGWMYLHVNDVQLLGKQSRDL